MNGISTAIGRIAIAVCVCVFSACGGGGGRSAATDSTQPGGTGGIGGGGSQSAAFSVSPASLQFNAATSTSSVPASQRISGTVSGSPSGTLYVLITAPDSPASPIQEITRVDVGGSSGSADVVPRAPDLLGPGTFSSTITVRACLNDRTCATGELSGSPRTINVTYTVGSATPPSTVMPHVATAGRSGKVVIRGSGLSSTTDVKFGAVSATAFTIVSDTEVRATHPPLSAGAHMVSLIPNANGGGSIVAVAPATYAQRLLTYPETPSFISFVLYDAERQALLVGGNFNPTPGSTKRHNKLWRYTFTNGDWSAPTTVSMDGLSDAAFSPDGSRIIALAEAGVLELSPDALSAFRTVPRPRPSVDEFLISLGIANDGNAIITTAPEGTTAQTDTYYYSLAAGTYTQMGLLFGQGYRRDVSATDDGSRVFAAVYSVSPAQPLLDYAASNGIRRWRIADHQLYPLPTSADANRFLLAEDGPGYDRVYTSDPAGNTFTPLATFSSSVPSGDSIRAAIINREGTRAFVVQEKLGQGSLHTHDISQPPAAGASFPELGTSVPFTTPDLPNTNTRLQSAISPDGNTLFVAGNAGLWVIPAPVL